MVLLSSEQYCQGINPQMSDLKGNLVFYKFLVSIKTLEIYLYKGNRRTYAEFSPGPQPQCIVWADPNLFLVTVYILHCVMGNKDCFFFQKSPHCIVRNINNILWDFIYPAYNQILCKFPEPQLPNQTPTSSCLEICEEVLNTHGFWKPLSLVK